MKVSKIPIVELNTVHFYQHYSLFMHNKLQYNWRGDYCECVRPAQLPVLTEVRTPSLLEQYPRYVPHRDTTWRTVSSMICLFESSTCLEQLCAHPQEDNCINTTSVLVAVRYTGRPLTQSNYTRSCINTIVLLKMSEELLETCRGFK